jgi:hypothetical protein
VYGRIALAVSPLKPGWKESFMPDRKFVSDVFADAESSASAGVLHASALDARCTTRSATKVYARLNVPGTIAWSSVAALGLLSMTTPGRLSDVVVSVAALIAMMVAESHAKETS